MGLPLHSVAMLREAEAIGAQGLPQGALMQRAGAAAARRIVQRIGSSPRSVALVCGSGNNGGDGYVCALELARRGHRVVCIALAESATVDAQAAAAAWRDAGGALEPVLPAQARFDAVVDAIFGIGLGRPVAGRHLAAIDWINEQRALTVALDVPSGLDADRGCWVGGVPGVVADLTLTFLGAKPGLFTAAGCDAAGEVLVDSLGVDLPDSAMSLSALSDFASVCAARPRDSHKGNFGNLGVIGGNTGMVGAVLLAARAALRLGAGRVFVECLGAPDLQFDPNQPELMLRPLATAGRLDAMVTGCGLGVDERGRTALESALDATCPVVLDADALNLVAADEALRARLHRRSAATIITPHPLEAARLLGASATEVQRDRVASARGLAEALAATVALKGAGTIIAAADGRLWINATGGPALATPGSGDSLAGIIGALLAQGFAPTEATLAAVWLHGKAADEYGGDVGLVAGEIGARAAGYLARIRREASV